MALHAILLEEENNEIAERIGEHYANNYQLNATCFLVRTEDISLKVAAKVGLDGRVTDAAGAVLKLNGAHSGFASSSLWEWFRDER